MFIAQCLEGLKILAIYFAVLAGLVLICGGLALLILSKFPNWTFNEMVFPSERRR